MCSGTGTDDHSNGTRAFSLTRAASANDQNPSACPVSSRVAAMLTRTPGFSDFFVLNCS